MALVGQAMINVLIAHRWLGELNCSYAFRHLRPLRPTCTKPTAVFDLCIDTLQTRPWNKSLITVSNEDCLLIAIRYSTIPIPDKWLITCGGVEQLHIPMAISEINDLLGIASRLS